MTDSQKILVVDDDPNMRALLRDLLEDEGYTVKTANNGTDGIKRMKASKPNLIILDIMMPGMDGYQICEQFFRENPDFDVPVIFVSARKGEYTMLHTYLAGGSDYLSKPFQNRQLLQKIHALLEKPEDGEEGI